MMLMMFIQLMGVYCVLVISIVVVVAAIGKEMAVVATTEFCSSQINQLLPLHRQYIRLQHFQNQLENTIAYCPITSNCC